MNQTTPITRTRTRTAYYIVATLGEQRSELVGPFHYRTDAESELESVTDWALETFAEAENATICVERVELGREGPRRGHKNRHLGYRSDLSGWVHLT